MIISNSLLTELFDIAVNAVNPTTISMPKLPFEKGRKLHVFGAGKAAASMARAIEETYGEDFDIGGTVITRHDHGLALKQINCVEGGHPIPDNASENAARDILAQAKGLSDDDACLCLVSGGGSSLLFVPLDSVPMADAKTLMGELLRSGAPIEEINTVRKKLSQTQGGRLGLATKARTHSLIISDVTGDAPTHIASGPTVADPTTLEDARHVLDRYGIKPSPAIKAALSDPANETPKEGSKEDSKEGNKTDSNALSHCSVDCLATAQSALDAASQFLDEQGFHVIDLGDRIRGEAREVAKVMAGYAEYLALKPLASKPIKPIALISGGETSVTVRGDGRGGRNVEFLLALMLELKGHPAIHALAADTDGIDGIDDAAGAWIDPASWTKSAQLGLSPTDSLQRNDGHGFFEALDQRVIPGPTRTNVNDFRAILIDPTKTPTAQ